MKVLIAHATPDLYGASRSLLRLVEGLTEQGHATTVILNGEGSLAQPLRVAGADVEIVPSLVQFERNANTGIPGVIALMWNLLRSTITIARIAARLKPDIAHTNQSTLPSLAFAAYVMRRPHIWHIREFYLDFPGRWRIYRRVMLHLSNRIVCVSAAVASQFPPHKKLTVINNGFPASEFEQPSEHRVWQFKKWAGINGHLSVGVVGRIKLRRKGQEVFIRAASLVIQSGVRARFVCIGAPFSGNESHLTILNELAADEGVEEFLALPGEYEDIKAAFAGLDVVVLPSVDPEPFGGVVIEAMALGKPVIGTSHGGTPDQIVDGQTGFLVRPGDHVGLAEAIMKLLGDTTLRLEMGANGREMFLTRFTFEPFFEKLLALYEDVACSA